AGAAYLAWLAWQTWRAPMATASAAPAAASMRRLYRDGVVTGVLNPKVALFQLALFPQFVDPAQGSVLAQSLVLGVTELAIVFVFDVSCVLAAASVRAWLHPRPGFSRWSKRGRAGGCA